MCFQFRIFPSLSFELLSHVAVGDVSIRLDVSCSSLTCVYRPSQLDLDANRL